MAAAPAAKANAIIVASRTVRVTDGLAQTPAKTCTSDPVAVSAHTTRKATSASGISDMIRS